MYLDIKIVIKVNFQQYFKYHSIITKSIRHLNILEKYQYYCICVEIQF